MSREEPVPHEPAGGFARTFRALRNRDFTVFWLAAIVSNTGGWLTQLAVPFVLFQLTGSAIWVALVTVASAVPGFLLGPLGGAIADRYDRRRVLLVTQTGMALAAIGLWLVWSAGVREPLWLLVPLFVSGAFMGLNMPSWQSFVNDLVDRDDLRSAVTLNSLQFNIARSLGPAIAGVLLAAFGPGLAFGLNAVSFLFVIGALLALRVRRRNIPARSRESVIQQFVSAIRYSRTQPGIVVAIAITLLVSVFGQAIFTLTVVFAEVVYQVDEVGLGLMNAALGAGAVLAVPIVSGWSSRISLSQVVTWGMYGFGVAMIGFALLPGYATGLVMLVIVGACFLAVISGVNTALQLIVADGMRGRVISVRLMLYSGSFPVGALVQGALTDWFGAPTAIVIAGSGLLLGITALRFGRGSLVPRLDDPHDETL